MDGWKIAFLFGARSVFKGRTVGFRECLVDKEPWGSDKGYSVFLGGCSKGECFGLCLQSPTTINNEGRNSLLVSFGRGWSHHDFYPWSFLHTMHSKTKQQASPEGSWFFSRKLAHLGSGDGLDSWVRLPYLGTTRLRACFSVCQWLKAWRSRERLTIINIPINFRWV